MEAVECDLHFRFINDLFFFFPSDLKDSRGWLVTTILFNLQQEVNSEDLSILVLKFIFHKIQLTSKSSVLTKCLWLTAQWVEHPYL